jgi:hypothetical protein
VDEKNNDKYADGITREYYSGTSSASAIIAGAALCMQGVSKNVNKFTMTPAQMRRLMSSYKYGVPASAKLHNIGVMPDLKKIIESGFRDL